MARLWRLGTLWACSRLLAASENDVEPSCPAGSGHGGCAAVPQGENATGAECLALGFDSKQLSCHTCNALKQRLEESGGFGLGLFDECFGCCQKPPPVERFDKGSLMADASAQDRDQDLHDFIKRKAPMYPSLEVEYMDGASVALELENEAEPDRIVRVDLTGWKSDHIGEFISQRLKSLEDDGGGEVVAGAWTAEIQSCSGWRLNQLPEARRFIKEPGHADTYKGLKVNFIPHHNPDLVFFDQHGKEQERLDLGRFTCDQIHRLMQDKGFQRKKGRQWKGEIRTCSGWRLNQLPEVRKFILEFGNADSYVGLKLNFIPHHNPVLILFDDKGQEKQELDLSQYNYEQLKAFMEEQGFKRKEVM